MWKKSRYSGSVEVPLNQEQIAKAIDILKGVKFLYLDIYGEVSLKGVQNKELERRVIEAETSFLSEIFNVGSDSIYIADAQIVPSGHNPLRHSIWMDANKLSGNQIVAIGFSHMYARAKYIRKQDSSAFNPLSIEREKGAYKLKVWDVVDYHLSESNLKKAKNYRSRLMSLAENEII